MFGWNLIKKGLAKTRAVFTGVAELLGLRGRVDQAFLDKLEKQLYLADLGGHAVNLVIERVRQAFIGQEVNEDVMAFVKGQLVQLLSEPSEGIRFAEQAPTVVMIAGVNGSGKTTSIAKIANYYQSQEKKVVVAACDTFRAAAVEQLTIWSERIGCDIVKSHQGADPASVAHDACEKAKARGFDLLIVDTAGRLHTQTNLMRELEKIQRIVSKKIEGAPHEVLLVLDGSMGQNALVQAEQFSKSVKCTGIILTKLDGSAKGGAIFAIKQKLNIPVKFIGVGEQMEDLQLFDPVAFVNVLFDKDA